MIQSGHKFKECGTCINKTLDPFQCKGCRNAFNYDGGDASDEFSEDGTELTYAEFIGLFKENA